MHPPIRGYADPGYRCFPTVRGMHFMPSQDGFKTKGRPLEQPGEASRGFEPLIRVLQTLALPLGHDAEIRL